MYASIPGAKTVLPKIVACEGPLIILTGAQEKGRVRLLEHVR